jgi:ferritin-like metal-binding protein YciE
VAPTNIQEQLVKYLTDAHSIEQQALAQLKTAPKIAGDPQIAQAFSDHLVETEGHDRLVSERLAAHGSKPSTLKDLAGSLTGKGFGVFAMAQPDTPGKLVVHAFSYEHMEEAAYDLLAQVAERAGDEETAQSAREIELQEHGMGDRLAGLFDRAVTAALDAVGPDDLQTQLDKYLADAHAIEAQALELLEKGPQLAGTGELATAFDDHRLETQEHQRLVEARLQSRGDAPSTIKDAALRLGALNWGGFFQAQPDTPAKLAAFAFAFEHLEIGSYEMLRRVAARAGDEETARIADGILDQENAAAERIQAQFPVALDASLHDQGVAAR